MCSPPGLSLPDLRVRLLLAFTLSVASGSSYCRAQINGGGAGNPGGGNQLGGILIDLDGMLRAVKPSIGAQKLAAESRESFITETQTADLVSHSARRYVSLTRLALACEQQLQAHEKVSEDLFCLAGLQQIDFLLLDSLNSDIVIAGPAEGFAPDASGRMIGLTTGRPSLRLDDLIVAFRASSEGAGAIGCSIDPDSARLAAMQKFVTTNSTPTSPAGAAKRYEQMAAILGPQNISVFGVPPDSHFGLTLVEADFRMKRISLGVEPSGVRGLTSHLALLTPGGNSIQRWWFTASYNEIGVSDDRSAYSFSGQRVQLLAQEEIATESGERSDAPHTRASTHRFAQQFTARFEELAARTPVFAELQNLFDLAIVAAVIHQEMHSIPGTANQLKLFLDEPRLVPNFAVARQVPAMSTFRKARRGLILGLVGGVTIETRSLLRRVTSDGDGATRLDSIRRSALESKPADENHWWWD